jgi:flagellar assembly protein FliH
MERGGCRFLTGSSEIDATLENRWRRIVAALGRDDAWLDLNI